jgi:hypothetical protein
MTMLIANYKLIGDEDGEREAKKQTYRLAAVMVGVGCGVFSGYVAEEVYYMVKKWVG